MVNKAKYYLTTMRFIRSLKLIPRSAYLYPSSQSHSSGFFSPKLGLHYASRAIYTNANCVSSYMHFTQRKSFDLSDVVPKLVHPFAVSKLRPIFLC